MVTSQKTKGFTLLELELMVSLVLGLLSSSTGASRESRRMPASNGVQHADAAANAPRTTRTSLPGITSPMSSLSGFTLIELMVTIAVVAILSTIATSSFKHFVHNNRAKTEIHTFGGDLQSGRSAAIKHGQSVTVCASSNGTQCSGSGPWDTGWIVFLDVDANGSVDAGSDQLLGVHGSIGNGDSMTGNTNTQDTITFNRFGMFSSVAAGDGTVTLHTPDDVVALRRCVVLSTTGKLRFDSGGDCP